MNSLLPWPTRFLHWNVLKTHTYPESLHLLQEAFQVTVVSSVPATERPHLPHSSTTNSSLSPLYQHPKFSPGHLLVQAATTILSQSLTADKEPPHQSCCSFSAAPTLGPKWPLLKHRPTRPLSRPASSTAAGCMRRKPLLLTCASPPSLPPLQHLLHLELTRLLPTSQPWLVQFPPARTGFAPKVTSLAPAHYSWLRSWVRPFLRRTPPLP